jgi:hypothetical protein
MLTTTNDTVPVAGFSVFVASVALALSGATLQAQPFSAIPGVASPIAAASPSASGYRVMEGESATYDVELRGRRVGTGLLAVVGTEWIDGHATVHARLDVEGGLLFARVDDRFESWFEPDRFVSRRFEQHQRELRRKRQRSYEIAPEQGTVREAVSGRVDSLATAEPLDDVSFLFYVRSLPLRVGDVDTIPRYFKPGRDVIIRVVRKETVTVPAGTFETIVVQPTITNAGGLFGQGGRAEVYFSDNPSRTLVMLRSRVPLLGSLSLLLRDAQSGADAGRP